MARLSTQIHMNTSSNTLQSDKHRAVNLNRINEAMHTTTEIP
jgi:hypothetical protein